MYTAFTLSNAKVYIIINSKNNNSHLLLLPFANTPNILSDTNIHITIKYLYMFCGGGVLAEKFPKNDKYIKFICD